MTWSSLCQKKHFVIGLSLPCLEFNTKHHILDNQKHMDNLSSSYQKNENLSWNCFYFWKSNLRLRPLLCSPVTLSIEAFFLTDVAKQNGTILIILVNVSFWDAPLIMVMAMIMMMDKGSMQSPKWCPGACTIPEYSLLCHILLSFSFEAVIIYELFFWLVWSNPANF